MLSIPRIRNQVGFQNSWTVRVSDLQLAPGMWTCAASVHVLADADLAFEICAKLSDMLELHSLAAVCASFQVAAARQLGELRALAWESTIRGRSPELSQVGFYFQRHVVETPEGNLCVPDVINRGLRILSPQGTPIAAIGFFSPSPHAVFGLGPGPRFGSGPRGPACDGSHIYVVEADGLTITKIGLRNTDFSQHPTELGGLLTPDTCAVDGDTLYVSDSGHDRVVALDSAWLTVRTQIGGEPSSAEGSFNRPQGLAARDGLLVVCDSGNSRLQLFSAASGSRGHLDLTLVRAVGRHGFAPGCFVEPRGVGILGAPREGPVRIVVAESRRVQLLTERGEPLQVLALGVEVPEHWSRPELESRPRLVGRPGLWGVAVGSGDRRVYVVNSISNELHVLSVTSSSRSNSESARES